MRVLITAGATRNPIDAMRYLSARSTGTTGVALARAWAARGLSPHLLGSAETLLRGPELAGAEYGSTRDLMAKMETWIRANPHGALVHSSAVGDYERASQEISKTPSGMPHWSIDMVPAPKIADQVRGWGFVGPYVTFKAAAPETTDDSLIDIAKRQRERVGCDLVFANVIGRTSTNVYLVGASVERFPERADAVAALVDWLVDRAA